MLDRSHLPQSLGSNPSTYVQVANLLDGPAYSATQLLERLGRITPSPLPPGPLPAADELVRDLRLLRILMPSGDGRWRRRPYLDGISAQLGLRYCLLTLLLPRKDGGWWLPLLHLPDAPEHGVNVEAWPGGPALLQWYRQAELVRQVGDGRFALAAGVLNDVTDPHPAAEVLNRFLRLVRNARQVGSDQLDGPLPALNAERLAAAIAELQEELLIDELTLRRIYRALLAGQHVILSGPPGTGKTRLAQRLPLLFWRDAEKQLPGIDPDSAPDRPAPAAGLRRSGYAVELVTATEEWSGRDLIGSIVPQFTAGDDGGRIGYRIQHGHLTRAILMHYPTYDRKRVPLLRQRAAVRINDQSFRGVWLLIDELNRAPVDAVFSSLLSTLSAPELPFSVPGELGDTDLLLPADFRIIATLNSYDRHFVHQLSEAFKRRFTFIEIDPPPRALADAEAHSVLRQTLLRLQQLGLGVATAADGSLTLPGVVRLTADNERAAGWLSPAAEAAFTALGRIFLTLRIYRKLGTAQYVSAALALFSGAAAGLDWPTALDAALADTLADQLQMLQRDELQAIGVFLESAGNPAGFCSRFNRVLDELPDNRHAAQIERLLAAHPLGPSTAEARRSDPLSDDWLAAVFPLGTALPLPPDGLTVRRLMSFLAEHL
jgi:5-methylcytosine-specific restriction protein B